MANVLNRPPVFQSKCSGTSRPGYSALSVQDIFPLYSSETFREEKNPRILKVLLLKKTVKFLRRLMLMTHWILEMLLFPRSYPVMLNLMR